MELHYDQLEIDIDKTTMNDWEPNIETIYATFDYEVDDLDIIYWLTDCEDIPEGTLEEAVNYARDHFDELTTKYYEELKDYFEEDAIEWYLEHEVYDV